ncbi:MAG: cytochrome c peroxidase [Colwellia sp.]|jgi:cytochrome c peroxidase
MTINFLFVGIIYFFCFVAIFSTLAADMDKLRDIYSQAPKFWPKANIDEGVEAKEIGLLLPIKFSKNNPYSLEKFQLGKRLFNDGNLSRSKQIACASCHDPDLGWADGRKASFGHNRQRGKRNSPTLENVAYNEHFFWDGRAETLEQQALMPIQDPIEMNFTLPELEQRLNKDPSYSKAFMASFGQSEVTAKLIGQSLATYQRTIVSRRSDFDRFLLAPKQKQERMKKIYRAAMSDKAILGMHLFRTKARCMNCHHGATFSDQKFHNLGLTYYKRKHQDLGRYNYTQLPDDVGKFKTPGLRGIMNTAPWMHNGLFSDMEGILNIYNAGGIPFQKKIDDPLSPETSILLKPLSLTREEISSLIEFLKAITAPPALGIIGDNNL